MRSLFNCCPDHNPPDMSGYDILLIGHDPAVSAGSFCVYGRTKGGGDDALSEHDTFDEAVEAASLIGAMHRLAVVDGTSSSSLLPGLHEA